MSLSLRWLTIVLLAVGGCRTSAPDSPQTATPGPSRSFMDLDEEPLSAVWKDWTPTDTAATPDLQPHATAFDYLQITDEAFAERAWATAFALLDQGRRQLGEPFGKTFRMLMTVLEPETGDGERRFDATFVVSKTSAATMWEGVAYRMWRELPSGATPAVTVLLRRWAESSDQAEQIHVWFHSSVAEVPSATMMLQTTDDGSWRMTANQGIAWEPSKGLGGGEPEVVASIVLQSLWDPVVGPAYLENEIERREELLPTNETIPIAMGLPLGDREIDQVFSDSIFVPRMTNFD